MRVDSGTPVVNIFCRQYAPEGLTPRNPLMPLNHSSTLFLHPQLTLSKAGFPKSVLAVFGKNPAQSKN
jgi:hypothetical protein